MIQKTRDVLKTHPCFSVEAHTKFSRIHLPVASSCNIQCRYCDRKYDCANESRPGVTSSVLDPQEALDRVEAFVERNSRVSVVGIAGPGDPLANDETFKTLQKVHRKFPELTLCVSTNGLMLSDRLSDLVRCGVRSITVTINAVSPVIAEQIYSWVCYRGNNLVGMEAAEALVRNQWQGMFNAIEAGLLVKVNSVLIPGINDGELLHIAKLAGSAGAEIMNVLPLIPQAGFKHILRPSHEMLAARRTELKPFLAQMSHCRQCRADACGIIGEDKDMEYEMLMARIAEYADSAV